VGKKQVVKGEVLSVKDSVVPLGMPSFGEPLYPHPETGQAILTNSMLGSFRRCIKQSEYKYVHRLKPKMLGGPLKRGTWVHSLLEEDARGGDWKKLHKKLTAKFNRMFDEEKEFYGDMPTEIAHVMRSYMWHYKNDPWKYHELELELTAELPNGVLLRIKFDALIENQWGLWLVDHKTHKTLPKLTYRQLDTQSPIYTWVAHQNNIPVNGFIWNYLRWKAPTVPALVYANSKNPRLSKSAVDTDYPTYKKAIKDYGLDPGPYEERLAYYKKLRYVPGAPQESSFFRRDVFERTPDMIDRVLKEAMRTAERMNSYDFSDPEAVERTVGRHCEYMCSYSDLCTNELLGNNTRPLIRQNYEVGDPMSYYHDKAGDTKDEKE
jgi:hypothetical protein